MDIKIALAGNPNCGKTTLFNALTGSSQYVGNWPGVTVEKKEGRLKGHKDVVIQDLPGIYSLSPYTLEEVVSRSYLVKEHPDAILKYRGRNEYRAEPLPYHPAGGIWVWDRCSPDPAGGNPVPAVPQGLSGGRKYPAADFRGRCRKVIIQERSN